MKLKYTSISIIYQVNTLFTPLNVFMIDVWLDRHRGTRHFIPILCIFMNKTCIKYHYNVFILCYNASYTYFGLNALSYGHKQ